MHKIDIHISSAVRNNHFTFHIVENIGDPIYLILQNMC